jgi:hypothetical protein
MSNQKEFKFQSHHYIGTTTDKRYSVIKRISVLLTLVIELKKLGESENVSNNIPLL